MTKNKFKVLLILAFVLAAVCCTQLTQQTGNNSNGTNVASNNTNGNSSPATATCDASATWVSNPQGAPSEIPLGKDAQICQFHQFSWQWFLAMMNMSADNVTRTFQVEANFPLLQATGTNSCTTTGVKTRIFVRTQKDDDNPNDDFTLPEKIAQAGDGASIYDQNGNVVFYEVRFSRDQCNTPQTAAMFPAGTTEIKVSYRVITAADKPNYVWINADINGDGTTGTDELLGMVGFHLVKSTPLHPEFVWATFEHKSNVPECQAAPVTPAPAYSFTSAKCAAELPNSVQPSTCSFNTAAAGKVLSGGPKTEICRVYHDGTMTGDNQASTNVSNIDSLNAQLVGPTGFITVLPDTNPLAVLKNYILVGALWENDVTQPSTVTTNQRGSIQLANSTMETSFQMAPGFASQPYTGTGNLQPATNCFGCHGYVPGNNTQLSHTFSKILGGSTQKTN